VKRLLLVVVLVAAGVVAASFTVSKPAATVNGVEISQSQLNADLAAIANSPQFTCYLEANTAVASQGVVQVEPVGAGGQGTVTQQLAGYWLSQLINNEVIRQLAASRGVTPASGSVASARGSVEQIIDQALLSYYQNAGAPKCAYNGQSILAAMPGWFVDELERPYAAFSALATAVPGGGTSSADIADYFAAHSSDFNTICVSEIVVPSAATASSIEQQLQAGTPFAALAAADSTDPSKAQGGAVGCFAPDNQYWATLQQALNGVAVGGFTQPLSAGQDAQGNSQYAILQLTSSSPSSLASATPAVKQAIQQAALSTVNTVVTTAVRHATITVDPRYGRWVVTASRYALVPPKSPPLATLLNPQANRVHSAPS
jgi:parvulin-like peptidyl-prolyl isomerase